MYPCMCRIRGRKSEAWFFVLCFFFFNSSMKSVVGHRYSRMLNYCICCESASWNQRLLPVCWRLLWNLRGRKITWDNYWVLLWRRIGGMFFHVKREVIQIQLRAGHKPGLRLGLRMTFCWICSISKWSACAHSHSTSSLRKRFLHKSSNKQVVVEEKPHRVHEWV